MNRRIVIHTGDADIGKITSEAEVSSPPTVGNIYSIGPKNFEVVDFYDDGECFQVTCCPYIEAEGAMQ